MRISIFIFFLIGFYSTCIVAQCPLLFTESSDPDCTGNCVVCLDDEITFSLFGDGFEDGTDIDWYIGPNGSDLESEEYIGSSEITVDCEGGPQAMFILIDPGGGPERCDEFIVIYTGDSGFDAEDIEVENIIGNPLSPYVDGNLSVFTPDCGQIAVGPGDFVPDDAILIIQTSAIGTVDFDIDELCNLGLDIYVMASANVSCAGGFFVNNPSNEYTVILGCESDIVTYPTGSFDSWSYQDGEANTGTVVPEMDIPDPNPGLSTIEDFTFTISQDIIDDYCSPNSVQLDIQGFLNPQSGGGCPDLETGIFNLTLACPEAEDIPAINACEMDGDISIDLSMYDIDVSPAGGNVLWFTDSGGSNEISNPSNYTGSGPVYAAVDVNGCLSDIIEVDINIFSEPAIVLSLDPDPGCEGDDLTIFEDGGDAVDWNWEGPGGFDSADQDAMVDEAEPGTYMVTVTDINDCSSTSEITYDPTPIAEVTIDVSSTTLCEGNCIEIVFEIENGNGGPYDLEWEINSLVVIPFSASDESTTWTVCTTPALFPNIDFTNNIVEIPEFLSFLELQLLTIFENGCEGTVDADLIAIDIVEPPDANNAGPLEGCSLNGDEVSFDLESLEGQIGDGLDVFWFEDMDMDDEITPPYSTASTTTVFAFVFENGCYSDPVEIDLIVNEETSAGEDGQLEFCAGEDENQDLFAALNGSPSMGGNWSDDDGAGVNIFNPNSVDFSGLGPGVYNFTYSFDAVDPCTPSSAIVTVTINDSPDISIEDEGCTVDNLFFFLIISVDNPSTVSSNVGTVTDMGGIDFEIQIPIDENSFILTITDLVTGCVSEESFSVPECGCGIIPDPEVEPLYVICEGDDFPTLNADVSSDFSANWYDENDDLILGNSNTFTPSIEGSYFVEVYDLLDANCASDLFEFEIVIEMPPNPGLDTSIYICASNPTAFDFNNILGGNPDSGGSWSDDSLSGVNLMELDSISFINLPIGIYQYTYTVEGIECPQESANVIVEILDAPNAGTDADSTVCNSLMDSLNLENIIAPFDIGGIWTEDSGSIDLSDPSAVSVFQLTSGVYTVLYILPSTASLDTFCMADTASLVLNLTEQANAGMDNSSSICIADTIDLLDFLQANTAIGSFESVDGMTIIENDSEVATENLAAGNYEFYHIINASGSCDADTAKIVLILNDEFNAGTDVILALCPEENFDLDGVLIGGDLGGNYINANDNSVLSSSIIDLSSLQGQTLNLYYEVGGGTCPLDSALLSLTIEEEPILDFSISDNQICTGSCQTLSINTSISDVEITLDVDLLDENANPVASDLIVFTSNTTLEICNNEDGLLGWNNLESDQNYSLLINSASYSNCEVDLDVILDFQSESSGVLNYFDTLCENQEVVFGNTSFNIFNPSGQVIISVAGQCDSTINVDLEFIPPAEGTLTGTVCSNVVFTINGTNYGIDNPSGTEVLSGASEMGCDSIVTVDLEFEEDVNIVIDEMLCPGEVMTVAGQEFNENNPSGQVLVPGSTAFDCDSLFDVSLSFAAAFSLDLMESCPGENEAILVIDNDDLSQLPLILTIDGSQNIIVESLPFEINLLTGNHLIEILSDSDCLFEDNILIDSNEGINFSISSTTLAENVYNLNLNTSVQLDSISWTNSTNLSCSDCANPQTSIIDGIQMFTVTAYYGNGCMLQDSISFIEEKTDFIFTANIFSPDNNGINDIFYILTDGDYQINDFSIFDRWGNLVWENNDFVSNLPVEGWDGKMNGDFVSPGVYVYQFSLQLPDGNERIVNGSVTIIR